MKILSGIEKSVPILKVNTAIKSSILRGDAITIDVHSIQFSLCTPFFLRN
ncbi:MAG: hypothetical protein U0T74_10595 [Chitinophagales bacterium]